MTSPVTVLASAARTVSGASANVATPQTGPGSSPVAQRLAVLVGVTAASGSPVLGVNLGLVIRVEWSHNGGTTYAQSEIADALVAVANPGTAVKLFDVKGDSFRVSYTIVGTTPSFTFSVTAFGT